MTKSNVPPNPDRAYNKEAFDCPLKKSKFYVEVRLTRRELDETIIETDNFREALAAYDECKAMLTKHVDTCSFDMVILYMSASDVNVDEHIPIIGSSIEVSVLEW